MSVDPIGLELANHRLAAIAEEMGVVLGRTALSPNIKERRDYSCAVFDTAGGLVAHAAHIPVHRREALPAGWRARGPAIVCEYSATTVVPPGWRARIEPSGGLVLEHGA